MEDDPMKRFRAFRSQVESLDGRCLPSAVISISDVALAEGHSGQTAFVFTVRLSEVSSKPVNVKFATADGTAKVSDRDYASVSGTLKFAPGETVKTITVMVKGDTKWELDETFYVRLSAPTNAVIARAVGIGTILNDEGGGASASLPATDFDPNPPGDGF
jgi:hypothetical protein